MSPHEPPGLLRDQPPEGVPVELDLLIPKATSTAQLMACLEAVFAEDEALAAVAVNSIEGMPRFVTRLDLLDALEPALKGVADYGGSDHLQLPGTSDLSPMKYTCPVDGQVFSVFFLDPGEVPTCPRHPGTKLRAAPRP
jgi:hypothetical protein